MAEEAQAKQRLGLNVPKNEQKALNKIAKTKVKNNQTRSLVDDIIRNAKQNPIATSVGQFINQPGQFMNQPGQFVNQASVLNPV